MHESPNLRRSLQTTVLAFKHVARGVEPYRLPLRALRTHATDRPSALDQGFETGLPCRDVSATCPNVPEEECNLLTLDNSVCYMASRRSREGSRGRQFSRRVVVRKESLLSSVWLNWLLSDVMEPWERRNHRLRNSVRYLEHPLFNRHRCLVL